MAALGITSVDIDPTPAGILDSRFQSGVSDVQAPVLGTVVTLSTTALDVSLATPATGSLPITSYSLERAAGTPTSFSVIASGAAIFGSSQVYHDTGLSAGTEYFYRANATDSGTNVSSYSPIVSGVTTATPTVPGDPINMTATGISSTRIDVDWDVALSGAATSYYKLERATSAGGPWTLIYTGATSAFSNTGLTSGTYFYRVQAFAADNTPSAGYATASGTTTGSIQPANFIIRVADIQNTGVFNGASAVPVGGGPARKVQPGEIVEFESGTFPKMTIRNVVGDSSASGRITIRAPQSGQAVIRPAAKMSGGFVLTLEACRYFNLDGFTTSSGSPVRADGKRHGIKVTYWAGATKDNQDGPSSWIKFKGSGTTSYNMTRDCTIRYVEVDGGWDRTAANAVAKLGIGIAANDHNFKVAKFPTAWQENTIFEHNYIHHCKGEGYYIGANPSLSYRIGNNSQGTGRDVPIRHIKVRYNYCDECGGNGISFKSVFGGVNGPDQFPNGNQVDTNNSIHHNYVFNCGYDPVANGTPPISLNSSKADVYNNWVDEAPQAGINSFISDGTAEDDNGNPVNLSFTSRMYNNVVLNCGAGIKSFTEPTTSGQKVPIPASMRPLVQLFNNTCINNDGAGLDVQSTSHANSWARNNICVGNGGTQIAMGAGTKANNTETGTPASIFVNPPTDLHLSAQIAATGTPDVDIALKDFEDTTRTSTYSRGAYEF